MVDIGITNKCNNNCVMCTRVTKEPFEPSLPELSAKISKLKNPDTITLTGGEPTIRKDIIRILRFINKIFPNTQISLVTNGRMLAYDSLTEKIAKIKNLHLISEIHGTESLHDSITKVKESYKQTVKGIKNALHHGISTEIRMVIHKLNYNYLWEISEIIRKEFKQAKQIVIFPIDYIGQAYLNKTKLFVTYEEFIPYLNKAIDNLQTYFTVKLYHIPHCKINSKYHPLISGRTVPKNRIQMMETCQGCRFLDQCPGLWRTYKERRNILSNTVSIIKCKDYQNCKESIRQATDDLGGFAKFIKKNDHVGLKPNIMGAIKKSKAATTNPFFLKAIIELIKEITPNVTVIEDCNKDALQTTGIAKVLKETNTPFIDLSQEPYYNIPIENKYILDKAKISTVLDTFDVLINIPKLKTHPITYITSAVKNSYGCIDQASRSLYHKQYPDRDEFSKGVMDISNAVNPTLTILDAITVQENNGPLQGTTKQLGLIIAGTDPTLVDITAAKVTNHRPLQIPTIKNHHEVDKKLKLLKIKGAKLNDTIDLTFVKTPFFRSKHEKLVLSIDNKLCTKCDICISKCPVAAIDASNYKINPDICINCFCCMEFCRFKAIHVIQCEGNLNHSKPYYNHFQIMGNKGKNIFKTNIYIFDDHVWSYYYWHKYRKHNPSSKETIILHVDSHTDFRTEGFNYPKLKKLLNHQNINPEQITNQLLDMGNYIIPAALNKLAKSTIWIIPKTMDKEPDKYFNMKTCALTQESGPGSFRISCNYDTDIPNTQFFAGKDVFLDIDFDYFSCLIRSNEPFYKANNKEIKQSISSLINSLKKRNIKPKIITISRSKYYGCTPPNQILLIEQILIPALRML